MSEAFPESSDQLTTDDMLEGGPDVLDEGITVPEREPRAARIARDHGAATLDDALAAEEPEVWDDAYVAPDATRSGRLISDESEPVVAHDVGIDGGAATAEEAAMHVTRPPRT